jgi:hypothetical protein
VADDGDALGVDAGCSFQKLQAREGIVEMVRGLQFVLQVLARFCALGRLFALEKVLHEGSLIRGKALATTANIEGSVAVFEEEWREVCRCLGHGLPGGVLGISGSGPMIEKHCRKGAGPRGFPEIGFEMESITAAINDLRRGLRGRR